MNISSHFLGTSQVLDQLGGTESLNFPPNGKSVPPTCPPHRCREINIPPTISEVGGTCPLQTTKQAKNIAFGGEILLLVPPQTWGEQPNLLQIPPKLAGLRQISAPCKLGGDLVQYLGGEIAKFPPQLGGTVPPNFPPTISENHRFAYKIFFLSPPLGGDSKLWSDPYI